MITFLYAQAADMTADFKTGSTVYMKKKGFSAEFMTCVNPKAGLCNGFHHNFSLWDGEDRNLFADPKNPGQFSEFGRHWLAGMVEHAPALTAFSSPTINCYRRSKHPISPKYADWAYEDRGVIFRVKTEPGGNAYIENRLPSSACSPHLVLAYTLAAGMDGVRRKLPLPQPRDKSKKLPQSLEEALEALEADTLLKAALGPKLVELFIYTKRVFEVDEFKAFGDLTDEEILLKEKEYYYEYF
ncbi:glutamine synthetase [Plakobranchus ocellatus]|uniref:Lengsin n=1 Tax=Plakobranchus ocellatus TaxID=259542 RepID=A0AAV3YS23_9GAST|nr:glutamine synthetase [Plakobranchus ocellatus]